MQSNIFLADLFRSIARAITVFVVLTILLYLCFVGMQLASGEPGFLGLTLNMFLLLLMSVGFVIAWPREGLGASIALGAIAGFVILGWLLNGFRATLGSSPLVWPLSLIVALIKPQSFDRIPTWITVTSWGLLVVPICLFAASWQIRRAGSKPETQEHPSVTG